MPSLREWLFALSFGVSVGCSWYLFTFVWDFVMWHLDLLILHLNPRKESR